MILRASVILSHVQAFRTVVDQSVTGNIALQHKTEGHILSIELKREKNRFNRCFHLDTLPRPSAVFWSLLDKQLRTLPSTV